jgi:histidinol-phosphate aminotransferase
VSLPSRRADLDGLATYSSVQPGPVPIVVRASSNEAPGPVDPAITAEIARAVSDGGRYPAIGGQELIDRLAVELGLPAAMIAVGDGSLSLLDRALLAHLRPGDEVVMAWRSYEAYPMSVQIAGGVAVQVALDANGGHDLEAMLASVTDRTRVIIVCNPNNPTGTVVPWPDLLAFLDRLSTDVLVVLDEAYTEYDDRPRDQGAELDSLADRGNVMVLRTFSKAHGLAGLRVGYLISSGAITAGVRSVLPPFPVSCAAVAAGIAALDHPDALRRRVQETRGQRETVTDLLAAHGLKIPGSRANFVWVPLAGRTMELAETCRAHGLGVRPFPGEGVRITVGDSRLPALLAEVLGEWDNPAR